MHDSRNVRWQLKLLSEQLLILNLYFRDHAGAAGMLRSRSLLFKRRCPLAWNHQSARLQKCTLCNKLHSLPHHPNYRQYIVLYHQKLARFLR